MLIKLPIVHFKFLFELAILCFQSLDPLISGGQQHILRLVRSQASATEMRERAEKSKPGSVNVRL